MTDDNDVGAKERHNNLQQKADSKMTPSVSPPDDNDTAEVFTQLNENIRYTDEVSFRLLGFVPFISGGAIMGALITKGAIATSGVYMLSLFGAVITYFLFRWELRNISTCKHFRDQRSHLQNKLLGIKFTKADAIFATKPAKPPLFPRIRKTAVDKAESSVAKEPDNRRQFLRRKEFDLGKTEAARGIYFVSICAWLCLPIIYLRPSNGGGEVMQGTADAEGYLLGIMLYAAFALVVLIFALGAVFAETSLKNDTGVQNPE